MQGANLAAPEERPLTNLGDADPNDARKEAPLCSPVVCNSLVLSRFFLFSPPPLSCLSPSPSLSVSPFRALSLSLSLPLSLPPLLPPSLCT